MCIFNIEAEILKTKLLYNSNAIKVYFNFQKKIVLNPVLYELVYCLFYAMFDIFGHCECKYENKFNFHFYLR